MRGVRMGQFRPDVARVVIDLTGSAPYQIEHEGDSVVVYLETQPAEASTPAAVTSTAKDKVQKNCFHCQCAKTKRRQRQGQRRSSCTFSAAQQLTEPSATLATVSATSRRHPVHSRQRNRRCSRQVRQHRRLQRSKELPRMPRPHPRAARRKLQLELEKMEHEGFLPVDPQMAKRPGIR